MKKQIKTGTELYEQEKKLATYTGEDRVVSSHELADELATARGAAKIPTGMEPLDRILDGVEAGELIVVTGPTGEGKTTLLTTITQNLVRQGHLCQWFTLEVTPKQFLDKIGAKNLPVFYLPHNHIEYADQAYVKEWEAKHRRRYEVIDWIEDRIIEMKVKYETDDNELKAVFIDHLHAIFSIARYNNQNMSLEIGDLVQKVKDIALMHGLVVFLIAHCKDIPDNTNREIRKEDIRDSGMISRIADSILGVWRIPNSDDGTKRRKQPIGEDDNKAKVAIFKNRRTGKQGFFTAYHSNHAYSTDPF